MKAAGALGLPLGLRDNIALIYLLATKRKRLPHDTQRQPVGATKVFGGRGVLVAALITRSRPSRSARWP